MYLLFNNMCHNCILIYIFKHLLNIFMKHNKLCNVIIVIKDIKVTYYNIKSTVIIYIVMIIDIYFIIHIII